MLLLLSESVEMPEAENCWQRMDECAASGVGDNAGLSRIHPPCTTKEVHSGEQKWHAGVAEEEQEMKMCNT